MAWYFRTDDKCRKPRIGWFCTRYYGHDGPCAAWPKWWAHPVWWIRFGKPFR